MLLLEKESIFQRVVQAEFHKLYNCIVMTGQGYPSLSARQMLHRLGLLGLRIFGMFDFNPHGAHIYFTYKYGSKEFGWESKYHSCSSMIWLGVNWKDIAQYPNILQDITERDEKRLLRMIQMVESLENEEAVLGELQNMLLTKKKADIEVLDHEYFGNFIEDYLPRKILETHAFEMIENK